MRVLYDSIVFSDQTFGGISRYFVELMNNLPDRWKYDLSLLASENAYLSLLRNPQRHIGLKHFPEHRKLYKLINGYSDRSKLRRGNYDIFHTTGFTPYYLGMAKSPVVITVHDMIYLDNHRSGNLKKEVFENVERTILTADHIIAISRNSRRELLERFPAIPECRVSVVHHGVDIPPENPPKPAWLPERYILFVGQRGGYKNFDIFFEAFSRLAAKDDTLQLVCTGRPFSRSELEKIASHGLLGRVSSRFVKSEEMAAVYAAALCFVFPSKREGFGMPILEAFASRCPVILSDTSCFPEIAGEAGVYFNPDSIDEIEKKIASVIYDGHYRQEITARGMKALDNYSWQKTAAATAEVYDKVIGRSEEVISRSHKS